MKRPSNGSWIQQAPTAFGALAVVGYLGFAAIGVDQVAQVIGTLQGLGNDPATLRFQFATSLAARLAPLVVGFLGLWAAATVRPGSAGLRLASILAGGVGILVLLGAISLWLDGPAVRASLAADELAGFVAQWVRGLLLSLVGGAYLIWLVFLLRKAS